MIISADDDGNAFTLFEDEEVSLYLAGVGSHVFSKYVVCGITANTFPRPVET